MRVLWDLFVVSLQFHHHWKGDNSNNELVLGDRKSILDIVESYERVYKVHAVTENLGSVDGLAGVKLPEGEEDLAKIYQALSK